MCRLSSEETVQSYLFVYDCFDTNVLLLEFLRKVKLIYAQIVGNR